MKVTPANSGPDSRQLMQQVLNFEPVQMLDAEGRRIANPDWDHWVTDLTVEDYQEFYRDMVIARRVDQEGSILQRQGELVLWVPLQGQEAAQIGVVSAARASDFVFPTYREHAMALARDVSIRDLFQLFRGEGHSGWDPQEHHFQVYTLVLAAQTLHATGYAMGIQRDQGGWETAKLAQDGEAVIACFGDGSSSEGDVHESMVFAASNQSPVVFFCQNNRWAISVPFETQSRVPLAQRAAGYGFPSIRVDGNDVLAVYAVTHWALEHARSGHGPVLIEAETYRLGAHTTADDPTKYRGRPEEESWAPRDPLVRARTFLEECGVEDSFFDEVEQQAAARAAEVREAVMSLGGATLDEQFDHVYAHSHPLVEQERAEHRAFMDSFEDNGCEAAEQPDGSNRAGHGKGERA
ncbi:thiamine pyrophosphate-dependent enzyme [Pseudoglutamicibacter albus]|uniref:thiamine pyrophosphate-dependent enzyme n=1 Tax=Pseudoglutamicibacter albus TaxID=98671 RepID=UPI000A76251C|nr:thiamine pyrophosphate-dependent enzyme [Pseudoglutamicibacter albus]